VQQFPFWINIHFNLPLNLFKHTKNNYEICCNNLMCKINKSKSSIDQIIIRPIVITAWIFNFIFDAAEMSLDIKCLITNSHTTTINEIKSKWLLPKKSVRQLHHNSCTRTNAYVNGQVTWHQSPMIFGHDFGINVSLSLLSNALLRLTNFISLLLISATTVDCSIDNVISLITTEMSLQMT
jgi:hypothetical protein